MESLPKQEERLGQSPSLMDSLKGNHEPVSTLYQYVPTEPVVLSSYVDVVDVKQIKLDQLEKIVSDQNKLLEYLLAKLK